MRLGIATTLALALAIGACGDDDTTTPDDGGTEDVVPPEDDGGSETDTAPPACPGAPGDEILFQDEALKVQILASSAGTAAAAAICRYEPPYDWAVLIGEAGPCRVLHWLPVISPPGVNLDTGDVIVSINGTDYPLADAGGAPACFRGPGRLLPALNTGDTVRARSTGGADVPAFDVTVTVPELPAITEPAEGATLEICQPWRVAWTPATGTTVLASILSPVADDRTFSIACRDLPGSPLVIPPELTGLWSAEASTARLSFGVVASAASATAPAVTLEVRRQGPGLETLHITRP
ncbi:MAG: hypothetical protein GYA57_15425 [Myxococcales bacterium]|nr:hypothetical protein [Myxococcales bacterium]